MCFFFILVRFENLPVFAQQACKQVDENGLYENKKRYDLNEFNIFQLNNNFGVL